MAPGIDTAAPAGQSNKEKDRGGLPTASVYSTVFVYGGRARWGFIELEPTFSLMLGRRPVRRRRTAGLGEGGGGGRRGGEVIDNEGDDLTFNRCAILKGAGAFKQAGLLLPAEVLDCHFGYTKSGKRCSRTRCQLEAIHYNFLP